MRGYCQRLINGFGAKWCLFFVLLNHGVWAQDDAEAPPGMAAAALERVEEEVALRRARSVGAASEPVVTPQVRIGWSEGGNPLYRNGVPYFDDWTIRAGATRLRMPAYEGWVLAAPSSQFYSLVASGGTPGDYLAALLLNKRFVDRHRTKYVSFYASVWVPQEHAFTLMDASSFEAFKRELQSEAVEERKRLVEREDFRSFEDYVNFKFGRDEALEDFVDGFMIRAIDESDMVVYFATSEFQFEGRRADYVDPMIMTMTFALVQEKLLRIDLKRLYTGEEDIAGLLDLSQVLVSDLRRLNGLGERRLR